MSPKHPIYIISKGRWKSRQTARALDKINVPYRIVVEPQEYKKYAKHIKKKKILTLPFSNLGEGSIPARNWVWEHAISEGHERHWILDDNIQNFLRLNKNMRIQVTSGTIFNVAEQFVERYTNVVLAGFNYRTFGIPTLKYPAYYLNTRIYSCILIQNDLDFRWRGRYNEDTDLSLRALKSGFCTILFNAFLIAKAGTMLMKGGNTDELYKQDENMDGRLLMAQSLQEQHPDIVEIIWRWDRWQHLVDYRPFKKNKLLPRSGLEIPKGINNHGMKLVEINES